VNDVSLKHAMAGLLSGEPAAPVDAHRALARGQAARRSRRLKVSAAGTVLAVALAVAIPGSRSFLVGDRVQPGPAGGQKLAPLPTRTTPYVGYPDSIAVIGHTTTAGFRSDPAQIGVTITANSWATGTNPQVNSVYRRILARHPAIQGHNINLSDINAVMGGARSQAVQAVGLKPPPDLVVMEVLDYDFDCPAFADKFAEVKSEVVSALQALRRYAPHTRVLVVGQFGSPTTQLQALTPAERAELGRVNEDFSCVILDPQGRTQTTHLSEFEAAIHGYEAAVKAACSQFPMCRYDNGAFGRVVEQPGDMGPDFSHLTVQGQAKAAAVAWKALQDAGFVPPD
jgi:hypothetical protein